VVNRQDPPESGETITWTNVGEETDIFFGFLISIFLISVHILYVADVTVGLRKTSVKRRRDIVDILGFDVAGKLADDIVKNTAIESNTVTAYPTLSPLSSTHRCGERG
jgi:hypothetical protein